MANEKGISANLKNMTANKLLNIVNDDKQPQKLRKAAERELSTRSMASDTTSSRMAKGGKASKKEKIPVITIGVGMAEYKKGDKKTEMAYGGMSKGKKHMYAAGGMVKDNPGLKALKAASPEAYKKITGRNA